MQAATPMGWRTAQRSTIRAWHRGSRVPLGEAIGFDPVSPGRASGVESKDPREMGAVHESSHFGHAVELVILMHEKLLRHFDPDIAAKRAQVSLRIVQEHACQGTG